MKFLLFISIHLSASSAFQSQHAFARPSRLTRAVSLDALSTAIAAKENLIAVVDRIKTKDGMFIYDAAAKTELTQAVAELEAVASPPTVDDFEKLYQGDWVLCCTTAATDKSGIDTSKIPFLNEGPLKQIRQSLNRSVKVLQRIRSTTDTTTVDRVDHVIEYMPPGSLDEVLDNLPDALKSLNLNPLELTKSSVTLVHKAEIESITPKLTTKLSLQSVVLNVAGQSQFLDPAGADVLGINVPLGEFLNVGSFDTTFMDETLRVSRGKLGLVDQLRVFVRAAEVDSHEKDDSPSTTTSTFDSYSTDDEELSQVGWVDDESDDSGSSDDEYPSDVEL